MTNLNNNIQKEVVENMAYLTCDMANKPNSCKECKGYRNGCFTIPKMKTLVENGYGVCEPTSSKQQAEINRLTSEVEKLKSEISEVSKTVFRKTINKFLTMHDLYVYVGEELMEWEPTEYVENLFGITLVCDDGEDDIDDAVKEMGGYV